MKHVQDFTQALEYVYKLGFATSGNISYRQSALCAVTDALVKTAGGYPYRCLYHRYTSEYGFTYPWLSRFTVIGPDQVKRELSMSGVKI